MKTMLDKCAVAGDITQAIDRRGAWSCAVTVISGAENTAVKLQSADSAGGEFTDFKTLISADDAEADQYKGFVLDLSGAGNFIKIVGATMATCVLGDCDHDVKTVAIKAGEIPSGADLEDNKTATIDVSTYTEPVEIEPTEGKDGMKKATVTLSNIPSGGSDEMWYCYSCALNGDYVYFPFSTPPTAETAVLRESWFSLGATPLQEITFNSNPILHTDYFHGDSFSSYEKDGNNFIVTINDEELVFTRESSKDINPSKILTLKAYKNSSDEVIYANANDNTEIYLDLTVGGEQVIVSGFTYDSETDTYSGRSSTYSRFSVNDCYSAIDPSHIRDM